MPPTVVTQQSYVHIVGKREHGICLSFTIWWLLYLTWHRSTQDINISDTTQQEIYRNKTCFRPNLNFSESAPVFHSYGWALSLANRLAFYPHF